MAISPNSDLFLSELHALVEKLLINLMAQKNFNHYFLNTLGLKFGFTFGLMDTVHLRSHTINPENDAPVRIIFQLANNLLVFYVLK